MTGDAGASLAGQSSATRLAAVQALYEIDAADACPEDVLRGFKEQLWSKVHGELKLVDPNNKMLDDLVLGVTDQRLAVDAALDAVLDDGHRMNRLEILLRAVLRAGAYELKAVLTVPSKVVITEYVDLAHAFFAGKEPALVNAVLDRLSREFRSAEDAPGANGANGR